MEIPVKDKVDTGPHPFGQATKVPAIGIVFSVFKQQGQDLYKISTGCSVAHDLVITSSAVIEHENCPPAATFLLRSQDYKNEITPTKIIEFLSHKKIQLSLAKDFQGIALLRLPEGTYHQSSFEADHLTISDIFKAESKAQDIKIIGYNKDESINSALVYEEQKNTLGLKAEEILQVKEEASSILSFRFGINVSNLIGSPVFANGKVFAIVVGDSKIRLISEHLYKFVEKSSLKHKEK